MLRGVGLGKPYSVYLTVANGDSRFKTGEPSPDDPPLEVQLKLYGAADINRPVLIPFGRNSLSMPVVGPFTKGVFVPGEIGVLRVDLTAPVEFTGDGNCITGFYSGAISNYALVFLPSPGSQLSQGIVPYASLGLCFAPSYVPYEEANSTDTISTPMEKSKIMKGKQ